MDSIEKQSEEAMWNMYGSHAVIIIIIIIIPIIIIITQEQVQDHDIFVLYSEWSF
jgi:hypothetical protein